MVSGAQENTVPGLRTHRLPVRPAWLGVILAGGAAGTAVRSALSAAFAVPAGQWPWVTLWINLSGALLLGVLLEGLAMTGPDAGWRRVLRLGVGTGFLGGYTTYSTFAVETFQLTSAGSVLLGIGYALISVGFGFAAAFAGAQAMRALVRLLQGSDRGAE